MLQCALESDSLALTMTLKINQVHEREVNYLNNSFSIKYKLMEISMTYFLSLLSSFLLFLMLIFSGIKADKKKEIRKLIISILITMLVVYTLKFSLRFERPGTDILLFKFDKYSFPSTHAALSGVLGLYISTLWSIILAIIIGLLRCYLKAHYLMDIIGGWIISLVIYCIAFRKQEIISKSKKLKKILLRKILHVIFGSGVLISGILFYDYFLYIGIAIIALYLAFVHTPIGRKIYLKVKRPDKTWIDVLSPVYIVLGAMISYLLYLEHIFYISLIFVAYIDAFTSVIGNIFPYLRLPNKRHLTGTIIGSMIAYIIVSWFSSEIYGFISSLSFFVYEVVFPSYKKINDNLFIPVWIGLWLMILERLIL